MAEARPVHVALALLERDRLWLLQLRDDIAGIVAPGCWGLFGGHLEPGESPEQALRRELREEISYNAASLEPWFDYEQDGRHRHLFRGPLTCPLAQLRLLEGQAMALVSPGQLRSGRIWSPQRREYRPFSASLQVAIARFGLAPADRGPTGLRWS